MLCWLTLEKRLFILHFEVTRSRSNCWSSSQHCPLNHLWTICLIIYKLSTVVASGECIIHCIWKPFCILHQGDIHFLFPLLFSVFIYTPLPGKKITISLFSVHVGWGESARSRDHPSTVSETEMYPFWFIHL